MHYKCKNCNYEFDVFVKPHPHNFGFINVGLKGCPTCQRAAAMSKVCPKCGSTDLVQSLANK